MAGRRAPCIVIGVGNPARGDDGAGPMVARALCGRLPDEIEIVEHGGEAASLLSRLEGAETAILIDACASGAAPGTVRRFGVAEAALPQEAYAVSTHGIGLGEAIELGRALGQLPKRCIVFAIEGASFETGEPMSPEIAAAVDKVVEQICAEVTGGRVDA